MSLLGKRKAAIEFDSFDILRQHKQFKAESTHLVSPFFNDKENDRRFISSPYGGGQAAISCAQHAATTQVPSYQGWNDRSVSSIKLAQAAAAATSTPTHSTATTGSVRTRGSALLDRVITKQAVLAALPAAPTKAQRDRRASLQRVEELARILEVLASGRARASFSMLSVIQQIQQSLGTSMSRVDVERCLSIMATEVMPHFIAIVASGNVIAVVITTSGKLALADLRRVLADIHV